MNKKAFTMIELVFVIVVLGILASIAIPRLAVSRDDAMLAKLKADIAAIRTGIALQKSKAMMEGNLVGWKTSFKVGEKFENVLDRPLIIADNCNNIKKGWCISDKKEDKYKACMNKKNCIEYQINKTNFTFDCITNRENNKELLELFDE